MAVKLRLKRLGRKKRPFYRIVAADSRSPRDGRFIEEIGYYNPLTEPSIVEVKEERALYWLGVGAIPSDTVKNLLRDKGITLRFELSRRGVAEDKVEEEVKKWEALQVAKLQRIEAKKAAAVKAKAEKLAVTEIAEEAVEEKAEVVEEKVEEVEEKAAAVEEKVEEVKEEVAAVEEKAEEVKEEVAAVEEKAEVVEEKVEEVKEEVAAVEEKVEVVEEKSDDAADKADEKAAEEPSEKKS